MHQGPSTRTWRLLFSSEQMQSTLSILFEKLLSKSTAESQDKKPFYFILIFNESCNEINWMEDSQLGIRSEKS